jgi:hypothetical protein
MACQEDALYGIVQQQAAAVFGAELVDELPAFPALARALIQGRGESIWDVPLTLVNADIHLPFRIPLVMHICMCSPSLRSLTGVERWKGSLKPLEHAQASAAMCIQ